MMGAEILKSDASRAELFTKNKCANLNDPNCMCLFVAGLPSPGLPLPPSQQPGQVLGQRAMLAKEEWFHGPISR